MTAQKQSRTKELHVSAVQNTERPGHSLRSKQTHHMTQFHQAGRRILTGHIDSADSFMKHIVAHWLGERCL